jgi:predicted alpha-1,2-mannosidase
MLAGAPPAAHADEPAFVATPADHVNTLIGTGTGGETVGEINNFPGAAVPFGMVQYSPDTTDTYAGYDHDNERATGFSMTHASVGCAAFGDISMLPTTTPIGAQPWNAWEKIAHDDTEVGGLGYYTVRFPDTGVTAELSATTRTGVGRFRYPDDGRPALFQVRSGGSLAGNSAASIQIGADHTAITGSATSGDFCGKNNTYTVYFAMTFSRPFSAYGTWDGNSVNPGARSADSSRAGGYVAFPAGSLLQVRTALSYVSVDGARANLAAEGGSSFDDVRAAAATQWTAALSRIKVAGTDGDDLETFYTALYRSLLHPNTFNDADGRYLGFDDAIHTVAAGHTQYANFSDWDTYRCLAALQALLFPQQASDMAQSLVNDAEQSGAYPRWALANSATGEMTGDNVVPLIVNLYTFGAKDFDVHTALRYMVSGATTGGVGLGGYVERPGIATYLQRGYAPQMQPFSTDHKTVGASITLEWAVDDFAISRFADALGDSATAEAFQNRAQYWQNLFDPTTGYISPRSAAGFFPDGPGFVEPSDFGQDGFDEGNAEQYVWWVPHNVAGLVTALGGRQAVADRLDRFTTELNAGPDRPYLWAGNEPGFGVPWLYNYVGQPWKTQQLVDRVRRELFGPTPGGEPGNDDLGALSGWYVWAALGLYPSTPGTPILTVATPLFDRAEIALPAGQSIRIFAPGASGAGGLKYIGGLSVDGQAGDQTFLPESIIRTGGDLAFALSAVPNIFWGTAESSAPPSFGAGGAAVTVNVSPATVEIAPGSTRTVTVDAQRMIDGAGDFTVTGTSARPDITAAPVSGQFGPTGSATATVPITVGEAVPSGGYPVTLTAAVGEGTRTTMVIVAVGPPEPMGD